MNIRLKKSPNPPKVQTGANLSKGPEQSTGTGNKPIYLNILIKKGSWNIFCEISVFELLTPV
jgi:hypothetical protein